MKTTKLLLSLLALFIGWASLGALSSVLLPHPLPLAVTFIGFALSAKQLVHHLVQGDGIGGSGASPARPLDSSNPFAGESRSAPSDGKVVVTDAGGRYLEHPTILRLGPKLTPEDILEIEKDADEYEFHYPEFRDAAAMHEAGFKQTKKDGHIQNRRN